MKKIFAIITAAAIVFSLAVIAGCSSSKETAGQTQEPASVPAERTQEPAAPAEAQETESKQIGLTFNMLSDSFCKAIADGVTKRYAEVGYEVIQADANNNADTMITQIENFTTMGVVQIIAMPMNSDSLRDVCERTMEKGIQIVFIGVVPETYEISGAINTDHKAVGTEVGKLAISWLDQAYPDAEEGSVHTACFMAMDISDTKKGSEAMRDTIASDPRVEVTYTSEGLATIDDAANATQNAFTVDKDIRLFLCYTADMAIGANNIVISQPDADLSKYAVFCSNMSETAKQLIEQSKTNDGSVLRGLIGYGSGAPDEILFKCSYDCLTGAAELPNYCWDAIFSINAVGYEVRQ
jgi:ribose transport system substrate-binding protein